MAGAPGTAADGGLACLSQLVFDGWTTRFVLFTGKGGVGKTTVAAASALALARAGRRVLLVSTDPASNLSDVFAQPVRSEPTPVEGVGGLWVADLDPLAAAAAYRETVVGPYRGVLPASALAAIEEQLSGACTVEVAAFGEFTRLLGANSPAVPGGVDHVIFDTAPTGHTLRMLELPRAWEEFLSTNDAGVSCLGPLSSLEGQRAQYTAALAALRDPAATAVVLVTRPEDGALGEAARTGAELAGGGLGRQVLVVNGILAEPAPGDRLAGAFAGRQERAWAACASLDGLPAERFGVGLMGSELTGLDALDALAGGEPSGPQRSAVPTSLLGGAPGAVPEPPAGIEDLVDALARSGPSLVLVMGKGGVGKTTIASALGVALAARGEAVTVSTTDPAAHLAATVGAGLPETLRIERIDPEVEVTRYTAEVLAGAEGLDGDARAVLEEDLRSPCTEEIAVFRAFAQTAAGAKDRHVIVDTAPTGHTLLLLDATLSYHKELARTTGAVPEAVAGLLPALRDPQRTKVVVVTLAETTPVAEAARLVDDLARAGITPYGWVVNNTLDPSGTTDPVLAARAGLQRPQLERVRLLAEQMWTLGWQPEPPVGAERLAVLAGVGEAR
ncbi:MAG: arsenical pump-driving ATPase [Actinomycetota bacterium]|nr:arsenical pump-driving ATPase [Actinomycetota bacterium]